MKVSLLQKSNQIISRNNNNRDNNSLSYSPAFKAVVSKVYLLSKIIQSGKTCYNTRKNCKIISEVLRSPHEHINELNDIIMILSKMKEPINLLEILAECYKLLSERPTVYELQHVALKKLFPLMDDNNSQNRDAKVSLIMAMYNSNNYCSDEYVDAFKSLSDEHYKGFKELMIDKMLNSLDKTSCIISGTRTLYKLKLCNTILNENYANYLNNIKTEYESLVNMVYSQALKNMTHSKNKAYEIYTSDFKHNGEWNEYYKRIFYTLVAQFGNDIPELSKKLNITESCASDIMKDLTARANAEKTDIESEKIRILSERIKEKFAAGNITKPDKKDYGDEFLHSLFVFENSILNFMEKSGYKEILEEQFKSDIKSIDLNTL